MLIIKPYSKINLYFKVCKAFDNVETPALFSTLTYSKTFFFLKLNNNNIE